MSFRKEARAQGFSFASLLLNHHSLEFLGVRKLRLERANSGLRSCPSPCKAVFISLATLLPAQLLLLPLLSSSLSQPGSCRESQLKLQATAPALSLGQHC